MNLYHKNKISGTWGKTFAALLPLFVYILLLPNAVFANDEYHIYLDADMTHTKTSTQSIKLGIDVALAEVGNQILGKPTKVIVLDHRGNSLRSRDNLNQIINDKKALVMFGGLHSPPLIANRESINTNEILTLIPWAAAAPITRPASRSNWIFRLSVDDSKAGFVIVNHAVDTDGFRNIHLLVEKTGWGESNVKTMTSALLRKGLKPSGISRFNWGIRKRAAKLMLRDIRESGADCIILVANAPEGETFVNAMESSPELLLPVRSHWGITGGNFFRNTTAYVRDAIGLSFIQTRISFFDAKHAGQSSPLFQKLLAENLEKNFPGANLELDVVPAITGFAHAYDLMKILIKASEKIIKVQGPYHDVQSVRRLLKKELENINYPVHGLVKTHTQPFSTYDPEDNTNAHEALGIGDFTMATRDRNRRILRVLTETQR